LKARPARTRRGARGRRAEARRRRTGWAWLAPVILLAGCPDPGDGSPFVEPEEPTPAEPTDVTFYAFGDPHSDGGIEQYNAFQVTALNALAGTPWPDEVPGGGEPVRDPLGVLIAGDITEDGQDGRVEPLDEDEIGIFEGTFGLTGAESALTLPVYEGYGNHEYHSRYLGDWTEDDWQYHYDGATPAVDRVSERNVDRVGLTRTADGLDGHYSWDWGALHLVNVNLFPGDEPSPEDDHAGARDPRDALSFLVEDLEESVGDSGRPVIVMAHYGFDEELSTWPIWWTEEQRQAFREAVEPYDVIAYIHGHEHRSWDYWWEGLYVVNLGSPHYGAYDPDGGHFTAFRVTDEHLVVADVVWSAEAEGADPTFAGWSHSEELQATR